MKIEIEEKFNTGYSEDNPFLNIFEDDQLYRDRIAGELILAIGRGTFKEVLWTMLNYAKLCGAKDYHNRLTKNGN